MTSTWQSIFFQVTPRTGATVIVQLFDANGNLMDDDSKSPVDVVGNPALVITNPPHATVHDPTMTGIKGNVDQAVGDTIVTCLIDDGMKQSNESIKPVTGPTWTGDDLKHASVSIGDTLGVTLYGELWQGTTLKAATAALGLTIRGLGPMPWDAPRE
jgi:hypothetical protein